MSVCSNFTPQYWKKDQCCECFRKKEEHSTDSIPTTSVTHTSSNTIHVLEEQKPAISVFLENSVTHKQNQTLADDMECLSTLKLEEQNAVLVLHATKGKHT